MTLQQSKISIHRYLVLRSLIMVRTTQRSQTACSRVVLQRESKRGMVYHSLSCIQTILRKHSVASKIAMASLSNRYIVSRVDGDFILLILAGMSLRCGLTHNTVHKNGILQMTLLTN